MQRLSGFVGSASADYLVSDDTDAGGDDVSPPSDSSPQSLPRCSTTPLQAETMSVSLGIILFAPSVNATHCYVASLSRTVFVGPFVFTDLIPLSIADADEYISLFPIVCPLVALRTKNGSPRAELLRS